jgi:protein O-mannosyl-transferase
MSLTRTERLTLAASVLLAIGTYAGTVGFQFVYDDVQIIQQNAVLHSLAAWREILTQTWWGHYLYRPFTEFVFAVEWALGGGRPALFHAVNALLHGAVTALVYLVALGGLGPVGAGAAALVFAVHPVHVEAVAGVVGAAELLAALFTLIAALAYRADGRLADAGAGGWRRGLAAFGTLAAVGLGLTSKEMAFAAPGVLLLIDWGEGRRTGEPLGQRFRRHALLWLATVALSLEWLWLRAGVVGGLAGDHPAPGLEGAGFVGRALVMAPVVLQYLRLLFFPLKLSADYSPDFVPAVQRLTPAGVAGIAVLAATVILVVRARRRAPPLAFGFAWTGGTVLVVANLIAPTGVLLAERTLYLPSVGAAIVVGWLVAWSEASWRHAGVALTALVVGLGMTRSLTRLPVWRDSPAFFSHLIADAPGSYRSYALAGVGAYNRGDRAGGEALLYHALSICPLCPTVWQTLAQELAADGKWAEAARAYKMAYRVDSTWADGAGYSIAAYVQAGMLDSATALADTVAHHAPHNIEYLGARAQIARAEGRPLEEMTWRRQVAWQAPGNWQFWALTAEAALKARACWEAGRSIARVRRLNPGYAARPALERRLRETGCDR